MIAAALTANFPKPRAKLARSLPLAAALAFAGCAVGPNYHRPTTPTPAAYKEAAGWKPAAPADATARGPWWEIFNDPRLNELEAQATVANQSLLQAAANYEQARQLARADHATLFPSLSVSGSAERAKASSGARAAGSPPVAGSTAPSNLFSASLGASWTPDFWGRVRRLTEADIAAAQASAADLAAAQLSTQSTLAQDYIQLRIADERLRLRQNAVEAYRRTLEIAQNKYNVGIVARSDVISAQALLDAARAQVIDAHIQRDQLEHAVAVLVGQPPSALTIEPQPTLASTVPDIPAQLPSDLLERRPDIAAAERNVAAVNARIGIQTAAYFPALTLSAAGGYQDSALNSLFNAPNRFWSIGASLGDTLFDFGERRAQVASARAAFDASVAGYRATVLGAFREVEDNLAALRVLAAEQEVEDAAVTEAADAARIALNEYKAGTVDYTSVVTAQVTELNNRQTALGILESRLTATVALIEALGGGWNSAALPATDQVLARRASTVSH